MPTTEPQLAEEIIRETARQVFSAPEYNRLALQERFWGFLRDVGGRVLRWFLELIAPLLPRTGTGRWLLAGLLVGMLALAAWIAFTWARRREARIRRERAATPVTPETTFRSAEELAERGRFTDAAHALYAAILATVAGGGHVRLHHSKTIGDYVRELRRQAPTLFSRFREFARTYELVIYGLDECDRERYERLRSLALPMVRHTGASGE